jgi:hypothetical protein
MNIDKILKRIKNLFREHYIYDKTELIKRINVIKNYSTEQINMALNVLITDKNEFLTDMLDRNGRLVNIDNFYLFQPIELDNKHITSLSRRAPIDVKLKKLMYNVKNEIILTDEKLKTIEDLQKLYNKAVTENVTKNNDWVSSAYWTIANLVKHDGLDKIKLERYCLEHIFDTFNIREKLGIINSMTSHDKLDQDFKEKLNTVIEKFVMTVGDTKGFVCADYKQKYQPPGGRFYWYIFVLNKETNKWEKNINKVGLLAAKMFEKFKMSDINDYNEEIFGFLTNNKRKTSIIFKTKSLVSASKQTGTECPSKGENRTDTLVRNNMLAKILDKTRWINIK